MASGDITKLVFSGSTDGRGIKIVPTATAGTLIHTAHATKLDEIWLWVENSHSAAVTLTVEFGGATDPDDQIELLLPITATNENEGLIQVSPGLILTGSVVVRVFASVANVVKAFGYVNRFEI